MHQDRNGHLWLGTLSGIRKYDGRTISSLIIPFWDTFEDHITSICQDQEGHLWFGSVSGGGVVRFDGEQAELFTTKDGLISNVVLAIHQDSDSNLWFGTAAGVSRYDGKTFTSLTAEDGLPDDVVNAIAEDREGYLWFGTAAGASRYDGERFTTLTVEDGLAGAEVLSIFQDRDGHLWFGPRAGASRHDGSVFQTLTQEDGLGGNTVYSIMQDREGSIWFSTSGGATRYRPPAPTPPRVFINAVVADRRYDTPDATISFSTSIKLVTFEFQAMSVKTRPEAVVYQYRLQGHDEDWRTIRDRRHRPRHGGCHPRGHVQRHPRKPDGIGRRSGRSLHPAHSLPASHQDGQPHLRLLRDGRDRFEPSHPAPGQQRLSLSTPLCRNHR